ncbi:hypothetical protein D3C78_1627410 [compost metagenome]
MISVEMSKKNDVDIALELESIVNTFDHGRVWIAGRISNSTVQQDAQLTHLVVPVRDAKPRHSDAFWRG